VDCFHYASPMRVLKNERMYDKFETGAIIVKRRYLEIKKAPYL